MDTEVDLTTVDRAVLIAIIAELQAVIERLQRRIAELEGQAKPGDPLRMPGLKAKSARKPPAQQQPRKQRRHGFARPRMTPTHRVEHVMENCPDCGAHLSGGWTQRTREVIELPVVPVQVTEHVYLASTSSGPGTKLFDLDPLLNDEENVDYFVAPQGAQALSRNTKYYIVFSEGGGSNHSYKLYATAKTTEDSQAHSRWPIDDGGFTKDEDTSSPSWAAMRSGDTSGGDLVIPQIRVYAGVAP